MRLNVSSAKRRPFCLGFNGLKRRNNTINSVSIHVRFMFCRFRKITEAWVGYKLSNGMRVTWSDEQRNRFTEWFSGEPNEVRVFSDTQYTDVTMTSWRNHGEFDCLFNSLFKLATKKTSNIITGPSLGGSFSDRWIPLTKGK